MSKKNQIFEVEINDVTTEGYGVGRLPDGRAVFVALALSGERAKVRVIKEYKSYCVGKAEELIVRSGERVEPDCEVFSRCGGCVFRHIAYESELEIKRRFVENALKRIGRTDIEVPIPLSGRAQGYRNKLMLPVGEGADGLYCGFYARHSHNIVRSGKCLLHEERFSEIAAYLLKLLGERGLRAYDEATGRGLIRHIYLRKTTDNVFCVCVVINGRVLPFAEEIAKELCGRYGEIRSFFININTEATNVILGDEYIRVAGEEYISDTLCGKRFSLSPASFYQVNPEMTEVLYGIAKEFAAPEADDVLLDLYCGAGTVGLCVAEKETSLCGVEIVGKAVENARYNAAVNGRREENTLFIEGDAKVGFLACAESFGKATVVVVDPPRKGLDKELIAELCAASPKRIVYISCNAATLARDCAEFSERGFELRKIKTVDLFPRTAHVECVVLLSKVQK